MSKHIKKSLQWLLSHSITVFSCVAIIALGMGAVAYATSIGTNISTAGTLSVSSSATLATTTISAGDLIVDTDTFYVDNDNNRVGIGTTTPYSRLSIWGDGTNSIFEAINNASSTKMVILNNGNVGIGTINPEYALDVNGSIRGNIGDSTTTPVGFSQSNTIAGYFGDISRLLEYTARPIKVFAHRGYAKLQPQNTLRAFRNAIAIGIAGDGMIETDIQMSSDGVPVLFHDATLDSITTGTGSVESHTLAELQGYSIDNPGSGVSTANIPADELVIPTFAQLIDLAEQTQTPIIAEIKSYRTQSDIGIVMEAVSDVGMSKLMTWQCTLSDCNYIRSIDPTAKLAYFGTAATLVGMEGEIDTVSSLGNTLYFNNQDNFLANPTAITYAYDLNIDIAAYTADSVLDIQTLVAIGINRIFSDIPINYYDLAESTVSNIYVNYLTGNVGIGTTSPIEILHVEGTSPALRIQSGSQEISKIIFAEDTNDAITLKYNGLGAGSTGNSFGIDTYWTPDVFTVLGNGNVGIGTTTPATTLDVNGIIKTQPASSRTCNALTEGGIMYDSDDNHFYGCNGTAWVQLEN